MNSQEALELKKKHEAEKKRAEAKKRKIEEAEDKILNARARKYAQEKFDTNFPQMVKEAIKKDSNSVYFGSGHGLMFLRHFSDIAEENGYKVKWNTYTDHDPDGVPSGDTHYSIYVGWE